jgi:integrase
MASERRNRGSGCILEYPWKNGDVSYRIQFYDANGKQVTQTVGRASEGWHRRKKGEKSVEAFLRKRISEVDKGYKRPKPMTFGIYADRWLEESQLPKGWSKGTVTAYAMAVRRLKQRFGNARLEKITGAQVDEFFAAMRKTHAARTVNLTQTVFGSIMKRAEKQDFVRADTNPGRDMERPKNPRYKPRPLTQEEFQRMLNAFEDEQARFAFLTFVLLGVRFKELRGIRWDDVDFVGSRLRIEDSKTAEGERWLALPTPVLDEFARHKDRTNYSAGQSFVFCHQATGARGKSAPTAKSSARLKRR